MRYREKAGFFSSTVSRPDQNILYQFLTEGHYERHLNRMRAVYKGKHDILLGGLRDFEEAFSIGGEYAGLHVLLTDRKGRYTEEELECIRNVMRVAVLYALGYLYEHREEADHHALTLTLRSLLFSIREGVV